MHLLATKNPETNSSQLDWDRYVGFDYGTYEIFRSDTTFDFNSIHSMSSSTSTWTDANPGTGNKFYRIAAVKPEPCFPEGGNKKETDSYTYSFSNIDDNKKQATGTEPFPENNEFIIYPNPLINRATIQFPNPTNEEYRFILTDLPGKVLRTVDHITTTEFVLEKGQLREGLYFIELRGPGIYRGKIVIE